MPYIKREDRENLRDVYIAGMSCDSPGELSYALSMLIKGYMESFDKTNFMVLNEICGVLTTIQAEFYRRVVAPYEDQKCVEHGDVWDEIVEHGDEDDDSTPAI